MKAEINYYFGAIFLAIGIVTMIARNEYFGHGIILSIVGFAICTYSYKQMERKVRIIENET